MTLQIQDIRFSYCGEEVLRGVTLDLPRGCLAAILGENGSGKTTLLKTLNRLLRPRTGTVMVDGRGVAGMSGREIARYFGYMSQREEAAHCTVFEAVLLGRKARDGGRTNAADLERIESLLRLVRLEHLAMRPATELSGGELQKVVLARALAQEPRILLLDEPINHLDPVNQIEVMSLLHAVTHDLGMTTLVVTHNINNALRFADRFILVKQGRVLASGGKEVITPAVIRDAFHIDVIIGEVAGTMVVVPTLHGKRAHQHLEESGRFREHSHEVDDHVYDHRHDGTQAESSEDESSPRG
ncbi:MAG: ATP-binding cassette domain-containing protein [Patescibacteria group bacterium]|nr:ATP-binding cassette domain-containing protein [Patescibacteria group bacterium]